VSSFTAKDVQALRQKTGAGIMDAKSALEANSGDMEASISWLREKGLASAAKRESRENTEGAIVIGANGAALSILELKCETDFVAKSPTFLEEAEALAELIAAKGEDAAAERATAIDDLKLSLKENIAVGRVVRFDPPSGAVVASDLHAPEGRGKQGVLIELSGAGATAELGRDIAMHIAFTRPEYLSRDEVPADVVAAEKATLEAQTRNEGKPEAAIVKVVEGKLNGFFQTLCLLDQKFVKDESLTITKLLGEATITRFARVEIGR